MRTPYQPPQAHPTYGMIVATQLGRKSLRETGLRGLIGEDPNEVARLTRVLAEEADKPPHP